MFIVKVTINRDRLVQRGAQEVSKNFDDLRDFYHKQRQAQKLIGLYTVIPSGMSGFSIWNVDSAVELDQILNDHPLVGAIDTEVITVTDQFDQQIDLAKGVAQKF
jgi:hypothetical protein